MHAVDSPSAKVKQSRAACDDDESQPGTLEDTQSMLTRRSTRQSQRTQDETQHDAPLDSIQEGDTNFLDLVSSFVDKDDFSLTQTQPAVPLYPESQRFAKTPATAGRKRDSAGNVLDTPVVSRNPFAAVSRTPGLPGGLTQAFDNTQAVSSPFVNAVAAELRSDLPSPGIRLERRVQHAVSSSPMRPISAYKKPGVEPSSRYIPSSESQRPNGDEDLLRQSIDSDWDEDNRLEIEQRRKDRDVRAKAQLKAASSPTSPEKRNGQQSPPSSPPHLSEQIIPDDEDCDLDPTQTQYIESNHSGVAAVPVEYSGAYDTDPITIPETSIRPTLALQPLQMTQPSPSMRQGVRIANSQRSRPSTQEQTNGLPRISSLESVELVPASPEYGSDEERKNLAPKLQKNGARNSQNAAGKTKSGARQTSIEDMANNNLTQPFQVPETSSAQNSRPTQDQGKFSSALEIQPPSSSKEQTHSSQPVHVPEQRRKRKRMEDISQEDSIPPATQISSFDVLEGILALDDDPEAAKVLASSPQQPVSNRKRVRLNDRRSQDHTPVTTAANPILAQPPQPKPTLQDEFQLAEANGAEQAEVEMDDTTVKGLEREDADDNAEKAPEEMQEEAANRPSTPERRPKKASKWDLGDSPKARFVIDRPRARVQPPPETLRQAAAKRSRQKKVANEVEKPTESSSAPLNASEVSSIDAAAVEQSSPPEAEVVVASNMVLAHFYDGKSKYYPAKYLEPDDGDRLLIQWPGYDPELVPSHSVCSFNLRVGDEVKVELDKFSKAHFVIEGLRKQQQEASDEVLTDIYGHTHVLLRTKSEKATWPKGYSAQTPIPIGSISIDMTQWRRTSKRPNVFTTSSVIPTDMASAYSTPPPRTETPGTPSSRSRNAIKKELMGPPPLRKSGIFSNMAFTLSYMDDEARQQYAKLIDENGGIIMHKGFEELFDGRQNLKPEFSKLGFTASLSNSHAAKAKHLQALALGLPCLSGKWIDASLASKALEPWEDFLLPAGESLDLDKAVKSRIITLPHFEQFRLSDVLEVRKSHFGGCRVLFTKRKSDKERPYLFLAQAMSAVDVEEVADLKTVEAKIAELEESGTVWLLVEKGGARAAEKLVQDLAPRSNTTKRRSKGQQEDSHSRILDIRVVDSETIKQTLIMGRLSMHNQK